MPFAQLKHTTIHYQLEGRPNAPVVVLSNSLGTNLSLWDEQIEALVPHFQVVRYDTRGHGTSSSPSGPYAIDDLGNDLLELMDLLAIERAHVCGISLGGLTALWLGVQAPHRVLSLMPCNTAAQIGTEAMWTQRIQHVSEHGLGTLAEATMPRWFTEDFRSLHPQRVAAFRQTLAATDPAGYLGCVAALRDADLRSSLTTIAAPTLVISGTHDPITPPADGLYLQQHIPGASFLEVRAAHLSCVEAAPEFSQALLQALQTPSTKQP